MEGRGAVWPLPDAHPPSRFPAGVERSFRNPPPPWGLQSDATPSLSPALTPRPPWRWGRRAVRTTRVFTGRPGDRSEVLRSLLSFQTPHCAPAATPSAPETTVVQATWSHPLEAWGSGRQAWAPTSASHQAMGRSVVSTDRLCLASCHLSSHLKKYLRTRASVHASVGKLRFSYNAAAPLLESHS